MFHNKHYQTSINHGCPEVCQMICGASPHALMNLGTHTVLINIDLNPPSLSQMFGECFFSFNKAVSFVGAMRLKRRWSKSEVSVSVGAKKNFCAKICHKSSGTHGGSEYIIKSIHQYILDCEWKNIKFLGQHWVAGFQIISAFAICDHLLNPG